jgi:hypothetical protein
VGGALTAQGLVCKVNAPSHGMCMQWYAAAYARATSRQHNRVATSADVLLGASLLLVPHRTGWLRQDV